MQQFEFHPSLPSTTASAAWIEVEPSIHELTLNSSPSSSRRTLLQRWAPNTSNVCQDFVHEYIEEIYIVEGTLSCEDDSARGVQGGKWEKGAYAYRKPGMRHGPFRSGEEGCLMFITCTPVGECTWTED
ncbi:uncharacterized protein HMPREF1541_03272 [Cyphellophora europaea CBS 101466]|uniref:ChrR-like cupin domain-containing protein n=1 Tax=Cyphellophora europaea (strain CBS 101466) TaxID=1220924 RepID=W2RY14_CYPE1|nr:uncharacterized protein HMPREF1541_03272 [Cyphellophora europaea CBS 101466]ETN41337.1 hypothetical protein HMPREF1541_03272 [Cyphellophora europaea CBS 101466]